jgi:hypothetical protein
LRLSKSHHIIQSALPPKIIELERTKREWFDQTPQKPGAEKAAPRQTNYSQLLMEKMNDQIESERRQP